MRVRSGPSPARETAATTLTLAGNARHASRAVPSKTTVGDVIAGRSSPATPGAPASPRGGFRVSMTTESRCPSTAAPFSPSSPAIAAEGAWIRAPWAAALRHPLGVVQERPDGEDHQVAARLQDRRRVLDQRGLGGGLDDEVGAVDELLEPEARGLAGEAREKLAGPPGVPAGRAGQDQARHPAGERPRHGPSDRAQSEDADAADRIAHSRTVPSRAGKSRRRRAILRRDGAGNQRGAGGAAP